MPSKPQSQSLVSRTIPLAITMALAILLVPTFFLVPAAQAQSYRTIYTFTGGSNDGSLPVVGLSMDAAGSLYGTTLAGGNQVSCPPPGCGTVYQVTNTGGTWVETLAHKFNGPYWGDAPIGATDGYAPYARAIVGPDGSLYGTTNSGAEGGGTVYQLTASNGGWKETVLYRFGAADRGSPYGDLVFDQAGNLYGTTTMGGSYYHGMVFRLSRAGSGWTESVLYSFPGGSGLEYPNSGVIFDQAGNLYGSCISGLYGYGVIYQLTPSGSGWTENDLYAFQLGSDGLGSGALIFDPSGNLYGTSDTASGVLVFMLSPSGGSWTFNPLYTLPLSLGGYSPGSLTLDQAGNLYGTVGGAGGVYGQGNIFELTKSDGGWTYTDLYDFTDGSDGGGPNGSLIFDRSGNLYGTTGKGGNFSGCYFGCGVVFEITP